MHYYDFFVVFFAIYTRVYVKAIKLLIYFSSSFPFLSTIVKDTILSGNNDKLWRSRTQSSRTLSVLFERRGRKFRYEIKSHINNVAQELSGIIKLY